MDKDAETSELRAAFQRPRLAVLDPQKEKSSAGDSTKTTRMPSGKQTGIRCKSHDHGLSRPVATSSPAASDCSFLKMRTSWFFQNLHAIFAACSSQSVEREPDDISRDAITDKFTDQFSWPRTATL
jgi:hypothetical protein